MELIESELSRRIIGCAIADHKALGPGFLECVYEQALVIELRKNGFNVDQQKSVVVYYDGQAVGDHRLDLIVGDRVVLELKACKAIEDVHLAIVRSYLKATGLALGLVMNFSRPVLDVRRVVLSS